MKIIIVSPPLGLWSACHSFLFIPQLQYSDIVITERSVHDLASLVKALREPLNISNPVYFLTHWSTFCNDFFLWKASFLFLSCILSLNTINRKTVFLGKKCQEPSLSSSLAPNLRKPQHTEGCFSQTPLLTLSLLLILLLQLILDYSVFDC